MASELNKRNEGREWPRGHSLLRFRHWSSSVPFPRRLPGGGEAAGQELLLNGGSQVVVRVRFWQGST